MSNKIKIAICGSGNLGRGVEKEVVKSEDMDLTAIFTRREPSTLSINSNTPVVNMKDIENWKGKLHQKSAIVDGEYTIVGSTNLKKSANIVNDENMLIIKNEKIAQKQEKEFIR